MNESEIKQEIMGFYTDLLRRHSCSRIEEVLAHIHPLVTPEQNQALMVEVTPQEIRDVVFSMNPYKAPRIDGYNGYFYQ